ncbi:cytochrome P450 [Conexibacter arvalis]|uniref:Cytochrome P450 n=1 Tax=Conexibacter arvalis TaxID=912552 RepID=A0A840IDP1_9ACTN|nr:cytochrome P450 [Conexibacter arvalis]MBB4662371.1 cytochrome P450 [Conexibacter arvalis]
MKLALPPGPRDGRLEQTVRFHRDPLGFLRAARAEFGEVFTIRLLVTGPTVVVAAPEAVAPLLAADPLRARGGEARRRVLGFVSPRSVLGADGGEHRAARARVEPAFAPAAVAARRAAIAELAERHARSWPRDRPLRLLPRTRALADDVFVRLVLGIRDETRARLLVPAIRRMLWTPGYPPLPPPGEGAGFLGELAGPLFDRRAEPVRRLLAAELEERRRDGDAAAAPAAGGAAGIVAESGSAPAAGTAAGIVAESRGAPAAAPDLIDCMVGGVAAPPLPTAAAVDQLIPLLAAGQEPPACALAWLLDRVAREPELAAPFFDATADPPADARPDAADGAPIAARSGAGVGAAAPTGAAATSAARERFVRETLRLRPPVHAVVRRLREPLTVGGATLPAGAVALLPTVLLHRDPLAFPDPDAFRPERWASAPDETPYLPFGGGERRCLGEPLAHALLETALPLLAREARLRPIGREPERMVVRGTVTAARRRGLALARPR